MENCDAKDISDEEDAPGTALEALGVLGAEQITVRERENVRAVDDTLEEDICRLLDELRKKFSKSVEGELPRTSPR